MINYPVIAIDIGLKRIGVAICYESLSPLPCDPILRKNRDQAATDVCALLSDRKAKTLVVGLPRGGSSEEEMQRRINHFCSLLSFEGEIFFQDEYASSQEAQVLTMGQISSKDRDGRVDSVAAMIILNRWIDSQN